MVPERFFWEITEGVGAVAGLFRATGEQRYEDLYYAYQATFYALLPENRGTAAWVRDRHRGGTKAG